MADSVSSHDPRIADEQAYVDMLFAHLNQEVQRAQERLTKVMADVDPHNPDSEALVQREVEYHSLNDRLDRLNIAHLGLVFGRIDVEEEAGRTPENPVEGLDHVDRRYIGRIGLHDRDNDYKTLILDWRAPMARPFYLATAAHPEGVLARRHIRTKGTKVTQVSDEYLQDSGTMPADVDTSTHVGNESILVQALNAARGGVMNPIVRTIQREQDEIIRHQTRKTMVVTGGPGTGKTAVALHRVAYLLYTWRAQLAKTGVLIVGPNTTFLNYISRVLPELGETGVVLSTIAGLYPGFTPTRVDSLLTQEIKGSAAMAEILANHVRSYQHVPDDTITYFADSMEIRLTPEMVKKARTRARRSRRAHNQAQAVFREALVDLAAREVAHRLSADPLGGKDLLGEGDIAEFFDEINDDDATQQIINDLWPRLQPMHTLAELLTSQEAIDHAAGDYDDETRAALLSHHSDFSTSDTALVDELAHLIGHPDPYEEQEAAEKAWRQQVADAEDALDILASSANTDLDDESEAEILSAHDIIDATTLAARHQETDRRTTAQRAQADYLWTYGHVVVDEAQELTPMEWRMVMRRSPNKWMTIVGDTAQTSHPAGVDDWHDTLAPFIGSRFTVCPLTVNYRTPSTIMDFVQPLAEELGVDTNAQTTIREGDYPVALLDTGSDWLTVAEDLHGADQKRLIAVIVPDEQLADARHHAAAHTSPTIDSESTSEQSWLTVTGVAAMKGLEFDHVIVVEPTAIAEQSPQGLNDLYVAYTRATQSLSIIGTPPLQPEED